MYEPVKIISHDKETVTFDGSFWDGEKQRYDRIRTVSERKYMGNYMSQEYMYRHKLDKYKL